MAVTVKYLVTKQGVVCKQIMCTGEMHHGEYYGCTWYYNVLPFHSPFLFSIKQQQPWQTEETLSRELSYTNFRSAINHNVTWDS